MPMGVVETLSVASSLPSLASCTDSCDDAKHSNTLSSFEKLDASTNVVPLSKSKECVNELEDCSLKDSERCNCIWQVMRVTHGIFHWLNSLSCLHNHRHRKRDVDSAIPMETLPKPVSVVVPISSTLSSIDELSSMAR